MAEPRDAFALSRIHAETWKDTHVGQVPDALVHERLARARGRDWSQQSDLRASDGGDVPERPSIPRHALRSARRKPAGARRRARLPAAVAANVAALACTLTVNVPINKATATWDPAHPPEGGRHARERWERFQAIRLPLLLAGLVLLGAATSREPARS